MAGLDTIQRVATANGQEAYWPAFMTATQPDEPSSRWELIGASVKSGLGKLAAVVAIGGPGAGVLFAPTTANAVEPLAAPVAVAAAPTPRSADSPSASLSGYEKTNIQPGVEIIKIPKKIKVNLKDIQKCKVHSWKREQPNQEADPNGECALGGKHVNDKIVIKYKQKKCEAPLVGGGGPSVKITLNYKQLARGFSKSIQPGNVDVGVKATLEKSLALKIKFGEYCYRLIEPVHPDPHPTDSVSPSPSTSPSSSPTGSPSPSETKPADGVEFDFWLPRHLIKGGDARWSEISAKSTGPAVIFGAPKVLDKGPCTIVGSTTRPAGNPDDLSHRVQEVQIQPTDQTGTCNIEFSVRAGKAVNSFIGGVIIANTPPWDMAVLDQLHGQASLAEAA